MTAADILSRLGLTANYKGFSYIVSAVELCLEDRDRLHLVTKQVYPEVARRHGTHWRAGELIWAQGRDMLENLARRPLRKKPGNAQFLAILTLAVKRSGPKRKI